MVGAAPEVPAVFTGGLRLNTVSTAPTLRQTGYQPQITLNEAEGLV